MQSTIHNMELNLRFFQTKPKQGEMQICGNFLQLSLSLSNRAVGIEKCTAHRSKIHCQIRLLALTLLRHTVAVCWCQSKIQSPG